MCETVGNKENLKAHKIAAQPNHLSRDDLVYNTLQHICPINSCHLRQNVHESPWNVRFHPSSFCSVRRRSFLFGHNNVTPLGLSKNLLIDRGLNVSSNGYTMGHVRDLLWCGNVVLEKNS